jgi:SAM-dependent methyltransferase
MNNADLWDAQAAERYDTPGTGMFAPEILAPAVERLAALSGQGPVLEFAIGTGRVAVPLLTKGIRVSGIEIAPAMLAALRRKVSAEELPVVLGDMASAKVPGIFAMVYLVFNGMSNLPTQADQAECFRNAARHLAPGGRFVIELWVPKLPHPAGPQVVVGQPNGSYLQLDTVDVIARQVVSHHFTMDGSKQARLFRSPHRYVWPSELDLMAQLAGFALESRTADWDGGPFDARSEQHISAYRLCQTGEQ